VEGSAAIPSPLPPPLPPLSPVDPRGPEYLMPPGAVFTVGIVGCESFDLYTGRAPGPPAELAPLFRNSIAYFFGKKTLSAQENRSARMRG